jgi:hypothetical protein
MIGEGLLEGTSGLMGLMARKSRFINGVYVVDRGLTCLLPLPVCICEGIGRNISGYKLGPALLLLWFRDGGRTGGNCT